MVPGRDTAPPVVTVDYSAIPTAAPIPLTPWDLQGDGRVLRHYPQKPPKPVWPYVAYRVRNGRKEGLLPTKGWRRLRRW